ncbi:MAG: DnaA/Hda family protein [Blastomonas sp.]
MNSQFALPFSAAGADRDRAFIVTACNRDAVDLIEGWRDWPFGSAVLVGEQGCGKTALGTAFAEQTGGDFVDDAHALEDNALFHRWNRAQHDNVPILFASRAGPESWNIALPDLNSRLNASQFVHIGPPDDEMCMLLLQKLGRVQGAAIPDAVAEYAASRLERSYAAIAALAGMLDRLALEAQRPIGQKMARTALAMIAGRDDETD